MIARAGAADARPRVAVVIVTYRSAGEIDGCLRSLATASKEVALECVVVDNDSGDGTVERVRQHHPEVRLVASERNLGFAAGCNRGIEATTAEYVLLLNPDARLRPGTLAAMVAALDAEPEVAIVGPALESAPGVLQRDISATGLFPSFRQALFEYTRLGRMYPDSRWVRDYFLAGFDRRTDRDVAMVQGACFLVRRDVTRRVGAMDERFFLYFEETDLCKRAHDAGWRVRYLGSVAAEHDGSRSSRDRRPDARHFIRSMYRFHRKHYGAAEAAALWAVLAPYHIARALRLAFAARADRDNAQLRADQRTAAERGAAHFRMLSGGP